MVCALITFLILKILKKNCLYKNRKLVWDLLVTKG